MTISGRLLACGPGWQANDFLCTAGPRNAPFEERHEGVSVAFVSAGSFVYRSAAGTALLGPGAVLLGSPGQCFECGHEHGVGDRCLSFNFEPAFFEDVLRGVPGARRLGFARAHLPPSEALTGLLAALEAARDSADAAALEELGVLLAGRAAVAAAAATRGAAGGKTPTDAETRRVGQTVRLIEQRADEPVSLADLARFAGMSPYHFLRTFHAVAGMTPHQYVLRLRLHRAAVRLRRCDDAVSDVAFAAGFGDLSTFNRRFRRVIGMTPLQFRGQRRLGLPAVTRHTAG